jgi:protein TonB
MRTAETARRSSPATPAPVPRTGKDPGATLHAVRGVQPRRDAGTWIPVPEEDPWPRQIALLAALLIHVLLITVTFPSFGRMELKPEEPLKIHYVSRWVPPPPPQVSRPKTIVREELAARRIPVPDPTPDEPEPVREPEPEPEPIPIPPDVQVIIGAPEPPPLQDAPVRAGFGGVTYPVLIESTKVQPVYPELARKAKVEGTVILEAIVTREGHVGALKVLRAPQANLGFEEAAMSAVRQWRYQPGVQDGKPMDVYFTIVVDFDLQ